MDGGPQMITWSLDWAEYMDLIGTCSGSPSIPFAPLVPSLDVLSCSQPTSQKVLLERALASAECYAQMTGLPALLSIDSSRQTLGSAGPCSGSLSGGDSIAMPRSAASSPTRALLLHATTDSNASLMGSPPVWNPSVVMDSPTEDAEETLALSRHLFSSDHSSFSLGSEPLNDSMHHQHQRQTSTATDSQPSRKRTATETSYSLIEESLLSFTSPEPQRLTSRKIPRTSSPETL